MCEWNDKIFYALQWENIQLLLACPYSTALAIMFWIPPEEQRPTDGPATNLLCVGKESPITSDAIKLAKKIVESNHPCGLWADVANRYYEYGSGAWVVDIPSRKALGIAVECQSSPSAQYYPTHILQQMGIDQDTIAHISESALTTPSVWFICIRVSDSTGLTPIYYAVLETNARPQDDWGELAFVVHTMRQCIVCQFASDSLCECVFCGCYFACHEHRTELLAHCEAHDDNDTKRTMLWELVLKYRHIYSINDRVNYFINRNPELVNNLIPEKTRIA
jgi:hypothetical protein